MLKDYLFQNWTMLLVLAAFAIALRITVFLDQKTIRRLYVLISAVFLLSVSVFVEFNCVDAAGHESLRLVLMAIRYSATPFIVAQISYALVKRQHWRVFVPAIALAAINFASIPTGIVFALDANGELVRGALGYLPFIGSGIYCIFLICLLFKRCNKRLAEIVPIVFLTLALASGLVFPFVYGKDYSAIFCSTIAVALFVYYVFSILDLTKKDALTGLLNRQAFNSDILDSPEGVAAVILIDMNGLKTVNDAQGHAAGDEALAALALCIKRSLKPGQSGYRLGGDEFAVIGRRSSRGELMELKKRIEVFVGNTGYSCSIGCSFNEGGGRTVKSMLDEADSMMYADKARYYEQSGKDGHRPA